MEKLATIAAGMEMRIVVISTIVGFVGVEDDDVGVEIRKAENGERCERDRKIENPRVGGE